jgi:hypothetical protein
MPPLEFMQRLAALVPRPRRHPIRFGVCITSLREVSGPPLREHGVVAPSAKLRAMAVDPQGPHESTEAAQPAGCEANCAHHRSLRLSWVRLLKRVFGLDLEHGPNCGGELKIVAAILEPSVIEKILTHLGLQARAPPPGHWLRQGLCGTGRNGMIARVDRYVSPLMDLCGRIHPCSAGHRASP